MGLVQDASVVRRLSVMPALKSDSFGEQGARGINSKNQRS